MEGSWRTGLMGGVSQGRSPHQTSNFKIFGKQRSEKQTVGREGERDKEKEGEAREEEGRKEEKTTTAQKSP